MHCVSWSDYDSQPQIELKHGIRLDTTYYYWPGTWINDRPGLFTGSGMPMRFTDRNGNLINVYQATTQMTDESGQTYPLHINTLLDNALSGTGYYGVFTANMHNDGSDLPRPGSESHRRLSPSTRCARGHLAADAAVAGRAQRFFVRFAGVERQRPEL